MSHTNRCRSVRTLRHYNLVPNCPATEVSWCRSVPRAFKSTSQQAIHSCCAQEYYRRHANSDNSAQKIAYKYSVATAELLIVSATYPPSTLDCAIVAGINENSRKQKFTLLHITQVRNKIPQVLLIFLTV